MNIALLKSLIFYVFFFFLLYYEDRIDIFGVSLSNLWKLIVVIIFLSYVINKKITKKLSLFDKATVLLCFSFFLNGYSLITAEDFEELTLLLILPISYYSFYYLYNKRHQILRVILLSFSAFLVLSSLPFLFRVIEPINAFSDSLERFGENYNFNSGILIGFFKQPSLSSKVFVFSTIIVFVFGVSNRLKKNHIRIFYFIISLIGLYAIYRSFTRTGWLMLIVFFFLYFSLNKGRAFIKKITLFIIIGLSIFVVYSTNEAIQNRVKGENINKASQQNFLTKITSGRNVIIEQSINSVISEDFSSIFLGLGKKKALEKKGGSLAHNRFIEIFEYGGILSLLLYTIYLYGLLKEINKRKTNSSIYTLSLSLYILMIIALIPSHGLPLWADIIFGGVIALNRIDYENELVRPNYI